jgi:hypothetical protein
MRLADLVDVLLLRFNRGLHCGLGRSLADRLSRALNDRIRQLLELFRRQAIIAGDGVVVCDAAVGDAASRFDRVSESDRRLLPKLNNRSRKREGDEESDARHGFAAGAVGGDPQFTALPVAVLLLAIAQSPALTLVSMWICDLGLSASFFGGKT